MLTKLLRWLGFGQETKSESKGKNKSRRTSKSGLHRVLVSRSQHSISRQDINPSALKVLYRLENHGFEAYLVGGGVRDLLLGLHPKDFDIVTNATPEQIYRLFKNSRLIGRRFKLVHVFFGSYIVEVATFRASGLTRDGYVPQSKIRQAAHGMLLRDNLYGSLEEDVWRRDFTVNALYYAISDFSIIDYVNGLQDLKNKCLRMMGDVHLRYREDPVRMLRAIRFAAKLDFHIHPDTANPIIELADLVRHVSPIRLFEECLKLFITGHAEQSFLLLQQYRLLPILFPMLDAALQHQENGVFAQAFIQRALRQTDERIHAELPVSVAFLMAILFWPIVQEKAKPFLAESTVKPFTAYLNAVDLALKAQLQWITIPKRILQMTRDLWLLHLRLAKSGQKATTWFKHAHFRAAYDFLILRAEAGDASVASMAAWWTAYVGANEAKRLKLMSGFQKWKQKLEAEGSTAGFNL